MIGEFLLIHKNPWSALRPAFTGSAASDGNKIG